MKIICVGRNYHDHARELKNQIPDEPVLFLKPETALILKRQPFFIPDFSEDVHHELELVVRIDRLGKHIQAKYAHKYYSEITLGIDFTARDLQSRLKEKGLPWEKAKAFDGSAFLGQFRPKSEFEDLNALNFALKKNDEVVQKGISSDMLFSVDQLISYISCYFTLKIGDLIYTGTPAGVGPVQAGDRLELLLEDAPVGKLRVK